ncbi:hypothetical protein SLS64_002383 [Diaporthe eres]
MDIAAVKPPHRKLVSVRRISRIKTLDSSQTHEVAMVDGWPVVVEKGQFAVFQQVLYFAIDCVFPLNDKRYESYRFSHFPVVLHGQQGWTVQTVKHEGHISQGMVFALSDSFPEATRAREMIEKIYKPKQAKLARGGDFQIRKWSTFCESIDTYYGWVGAQRTEISTDPPDGGVTLGRSPSFLPATKFQRVQNISQLWQTHGDTEFQIMELLDGMPMTFYDVTYSKRLHSHLPGVILNDEAENGVRHRPTYGVSIRDHDYEETEASVSWKAVRAQGITDEFLDQTDRNFGIAGVLCGATIAGNPLMVNGHRYYVYAVCDDFKTWKTADDHDNEWDGLLEPLKHVPRFATRVRLSAFAKDLEELMKKAQGASCVSRSTRNKYPSLKRKGLVFRALDGSFSFKVIADDWLLDETEKLRKAGKVVSRPGPNDCV